MSTGDDELRKPRRRQLVERQIRVEGRFSPSKHWSKCDRRVDQFARERVGITPDQPQKADDPFLVREILIPQLANIGQQRPGGWIVLAQCECPGLQ